MTVHSDTAQLVMRGKWRDVITHADGTVEETEWQPNQIQNAAAVLAASLFSRYGELPAGLGWGGITYMAFGTGEVGWDTIPPTQDPADTTLTTEVYRKAIAAADMTFSDGAQSPVGPPSRFILISVELLAGEANGNSLREFALFGGDATGVQDSGLIMNWRVHDRIDKDSSFSIQRQVEIEFLEP